jgi:serine/threonine protein kinase
MQEEARTVGRYELHGVFASGGMARVHYGRLEGAAGFRRVVAIKRLHPAYARDPSFRAMLIDEARLVASVRHANVAAVLDVIDADEELSLVLEYISGESLARLAGESRERGVPIPPAISVALAAGILRGLHAAHEATEASGAPLGLVHRDVSPHNVVVGVDGVPRVIDFGVAKALGRAQSTSHGEVKGKAAYMAPEQVRGEAVDRRADVFAAGIVVWELLTGQRLFEADSGAASMMRILDLTAIPPSQLADGLSPEVDAVVLRALARDRKERFASAGEMADALEAALRPAPAAQVSAWVQQLAGETLRARAEQVRRIEAAIPLSSPSTAALSGTSLERPDRESVPVDFTVTDTSTASGSRRSRLTVLLVPLALVGLLAGVFAARAGLASGASASTPAALSASASTASAVPVDPPSAAPSASVAALAAPAGSADPVVAPASSSAASATASGVAAHPHPAAHAGARPTPRPRPTRNNCTPPYTIDANGGHTFKPECL